jgi:hypothetical protein
VKGEHFYLTEVIFVQLRKSLELIALASMAANTTLYATAHAKFHEHWKATKILDGLAKLNPHFFPKAVRVAARSALSDGRDQVQFDVVKEDVLTRDDFISLYDTSSKVLHTRNPFSEKPEAITLSYPIPQCVRRIRNLVRMHMVVVNDTAYLVQVPDRGKIPVQTAIANLPA